MEGSSHRKLQRQSPRLSESGNVDDDERRSDLGVGLALGWDRPAEDRVFEEKCKERRARGTVSTSSCDVLDEGPNIQEDEVRYLSQYVSMENSQVSPADVDNGRARPRPFLDQGGLDVVKGTSGTQWGNDQTGCSDLTLHGPSFTTGQEGGKEYIRRPTGDTIAIAGFICVGSHPSRSMIVRVSSDIFLSYQVILA